MCLILFQWKKHAHYKLIVAANRDEFYRRPTARAHFWEDESDVLAGRDLLQMGTWLGITKHGRFAALTNYRSPEQSADGKKSRGGIVRDFLTGNMEPKAYAATLEKTRNQYTGYNVMIGNPDQLYYYSNMEDKFKQIPRGTHGLSNHLLNSPWPKVVKGRRKLQEYVQGKREIDINSLFDILSDSEKAPEDDLPQTGIYPELEQTLSPLFIRTPEYGTRSSAVLLMDYDHQVTFVERVYDKGTYRAENQFAFQLD